MIPDPSTFDRRPYKVLSLLFLVFLILMVRAANRGEGGRWWAFIHQIPYGDKLGHVCLMFTLSFLGNLAFTPRPVPLLPSFITRTSLLLLLLVSVEELSQAFLPTRSCDLSDWLADLTGLALGQFFSRSLPGMKA